MNGWNVLRVHCGLDGMRDDKWEGDMFSFMLKEPCSYWDALRHCKYFAEIDKMPGVVRVLNIRQAVKVVPGLSDVQDFAAWGARVVINKNNETIDVYYPIDFCAEKEVVDNG